MGNPHLSLTIVYLLFLLYLFSNTMSTSSTTNSANSSSHPIPLTHIHHLITIKLTRENYLLWKAQIVPYLRDQHLYGFLDGSRSVPSSTITNTSSTAT